MYEVVCNSSGALAKDSLKKYLLTNACYNLLISYVRLWEVLEFIIYMEECIFLVDSMWR